MSSTKRVVVPEAEEIIGQYFPVLDYGFVSLCDYMGGDASIERAARVSYGSGTRKVSDTRNLIRYLFRHKHTSPFEHVEFSLHIGLPIVAMRQLIRHRTANVNEYSGRYSIMPLMIYTPSKERLGKQSKSNKQGTGDMLSETQAEYFLSKLNDLYEDSGAFYKQAVLDDVSREIARIDLPLSTYTFAYWKIDLRNMFNVLSLRCDSHAQEEIRVYANVMAGIVQRLCPIAFEAFQDYQQTAVTFTQAELKALPYISMWKGCKNNSEIQAQFNKQVLDEYCGIPCTKSGGESREQAEFWEKLRPRSKTDYSLNLETAKPATFFEELMRKHAVETP